VFVVVLVISLLTALGLFAVKSSTLSNRVSGYNRQLVQTHYVTELGVVATAGDLKTSLHNTFYLLKKRIPDPMSGDAVCEAFQHQQFPNCVLMSYDDLQYQASVPLFSPQSTGVHGSLGPEPVDTDMRVEITDPVEMDAPGGFQVGGGSEDTQGQRFAMLTVTVTGVVMPPSGLAPGSDNFTQATTTAAGIERQRAHVKIGPLLAQR
jgi:hypothetical protein